MRNIEFRAWDGELMYSQEDIGDEYDFVIGGEHSLALTVNQQFHECGSGVAEEYWQYVIVDSKFMQYTGLKDCNGVKIFEGDIVSHKNGRLGAVKYLEGIAAFEFNLSGVVYCQEAGVYGEDMKVIGNIYENEDLL